MVSQFAGVALRGNNSFVVALWRGSVEALRGNNGLVVSYFVGAALRGNNS